MNKLTDTFVLSNSVKVPCVGYGTYLTPNLGFTGWLPENAPADAIV